MNVKDKNGSITIFVLVGLLFMLSFLILSYANNLNKSKVSKEQFEIINSIYQYSDALEDVRLVTPIVGQYVKYDVEYTDMYEGIKLGKEIDNSLKEKYKYIESGWRYLGTDGSGNHLIISTGIPMMLKHFWSTGGNSSKWWGEGTEINERAVNGLMKNLAMIPYQKVSPGTIKTDDNIEDNKHKMIGLFDGTTIGSGDSTYVAVGDRFKAEGQSYSGKIEHVRTLTKAEIISALSKATGKDESYITQKINEGGFANILNGIDEYNAAYGLFELLRIEIGIENDGNYPNKYFYWLANTVPIYELETGLLAVYWNSVGEFEPMIGGLNARDCGVRPVVVLSENVYFTADEDGVLEIH